MALSKEKVTVFWSKKEQDWMTRWPEWENRNAKILGRNLLGMIEDFKNPNGENLRDFLRTSGFDPDTFSMKVHAKLDENRHD